VPQATKLFVLHVTKFCAHRWHPSTEGMLARDRTRSDVRWRGWLWGPVLPSQGSGDRAPVHVSSTFDNDAFDPVCGRER